MKMQQSFCSSSVNCRSCQKIVVIASSSPNCREIRNCQSFKINLNTMISAKFKILWKSTEFVQNFFRIPQNRPRNSAEIYFRILKRFRRILQTSKSVLQKNSPAYVINPWISAADLFFPCVLLKYFSLFLFTFHGILWNLFVPILHGFFPQKNVENIPAEIHGKVRNLWKIYSRVKQGDIIFRRWGN